MKKKKNNTTVVWSVRTHPRLKSDLKLLAKKNKMTLNEYVCIKLSIIAFPKTSALPPRKI